MESVITREKPRRWSQPAGDAPAAGRRHRKAAITVGVLFIVGDLAGVLSVLVTGGMLDGPDALTRIAADQSQLVLGALHFSALKETPA